MTERTLAIIKPDAVERRLAGAIMQRIEDAGFLADLSEKLLPGFPAPGLLARISRIDVYAPPYRPDAPRLEAGKLFFEAP